MFEIATVWLTARVTPENDIADPDAGVTNIFGAGLEHVRLYEYGLILPGASFVL